MKLQNLFISNFKIVKKITGVILVIAVLAMIYQQLMFSYYQEDNWRRILWHNFYKTENIDNLYVGSSHVYCNINPFILDELTGKDNFNLSTGSQELITTYYLLKEGLRCHDIEHAFIELYYVPSTGVRGDYSSGEAMQNMWQNTDNMKWSFNKVQAIIDGNTKEHYVDALLPFVRYRYYLFDAAYISRMHEAKKSEDFKEYRYHHENESGVIEYQDKGFYYTDKVLSNALYAQERTSEEMYLTADAEKYLRKILELCREEGIEITLFVSPMYTLQMLSTDTYDNYRNDIVEIAQEYDVEFYDFNLVKEEYLPIQEMNLYFDMGHLNYTGASIYTQFFYDLVLNRSYDVNKVFYNSYEDKIKGIPEKTWGIYTEERDDGHKIYHIATSPRTGSEHKVIISPYGGEQYVLQEFSTNTAFEIYGNGIITVITRSSDGIESAMNVLY